MKYTPSVSSKPKQSNGSNTKENKINDDDNSNNNNNNNNDNNNNNQFFTKTGREKLLASRWKDEDVDKRCFEWMNNWTDPYGNWHSRPVPTAFIHKVVHWEEDQNN